MMLRSTVFAWSLLLALGFYFTGFFLFGHDDAKFVVDAVVIGCAVSICVTWFANFSSAVLRGVQDGTDNIFVTIWGTWAVILGYFCWIVAFQLAGRPVLWQQSPVGGVFSVLLDIMGIYAILTPLNTGVHLPRPKVVWMVVGVACGGIVTGVVMTAAIFHLISLDG